MKVSRSEREAIAKILGRCEYGCKCIPQAHRIKRGHDNGEYLLTNLAWLCDPHHKERHCMERMGRKG